MKTRILLLSVLLALGACAKEPVTRASALKSIGGLPAQYQCIESENGQQRCYYVVVPPEGKPIGLIVALHPSMTPVDIAERTVHIARLATRAGYVVAWPQGVGDQWNDGRVMKKVKTYQRQTDDVAFLDAMIHSLQRDYGFTVEQTSIAGMSNGGMMALRMVCQSNSFARAATVVANLPKDLGCTAKPKPLLMVFGTEDDVVDYDGGVLADFGGPDDYGEVLSASDTELFFIRRNGCAPSRLMVGELADEKIDSTKAKLRQYENCGEAPLETITVEGMGHTWPGEPSRVASFITGRGPITGQFEGGQEILKFFGKTMPTYMIDPTTLPINQPRWLRERNARKARGGKH